MKTANGEYKEIIVTAMEDIGVSKQVFWNHGQVMAYIQDNTPITIFDYYVRDPRRFTKEQYPELYSE